MSYWPWFNSSNPILFHQTHLLIKFFVIFFMTLALRWSCFSLRNNSEIFYWHFLRILNFWILILVFYKLDFLYISGHIVKLNLRIIRNDKFPSLIEILGGILNLSRWLAIWLLLLRSRSEWIQYFFNPLGFCIWKYFWSSNGFLLLLLLYFQFLEFFYFFICLEYQMTFLDSLIYRFRLYQTFSNKVHNQYRNYQRIKYVANR